MTIVNFKYQNNTREDAVAFCDDIYSLMPNRFQWLVDGLKCILSRLGNDKVTSSDLAPITDLYFESQKQGDGSSASNEAGILKSMIECYVLLVEAKLEKELFDHDNNAKKKIRNARIKLRRIMQDIANVVLSFMNETEGVESIEEKEDGVSIVIGSKNIDFTAIETCIDKIGLIEIDDIFYNPSNKNKGFFATLKRWFWNPEKEAYRNEVKEWLTSFLDQIADAQEMIGNSSVMAAFLRRYAKKDKSHKINKIYEEYGWHTVSCRWFMFLTGLGATVACFFLGYSKEIVRRAYVPPRYPYLPPEIDDRPIPSGPAVEDLWIYSTLKHVLIIVGVLLLVEFLFTELRILRPSFRAWKEYLSRRKVALRYRYKPQYFVLAKRIAVSLLVICVLAGGVFSYSVLFPREHVLTEAEVIDSIASISPREGALFYVNNKEEIPFLESLYSSTIFPALEECDYLELKETLPVLKNSQFASQIKTWMKEKRSGYLAFVKEEIAKNEEAELAAIDKYMLPVLDVELDSLISENVASILNSYSGGLFNVRKLTFLLGRDSTEFIKIFNRDVDLPGYDKCVSEYVKNCMYIINYQQNKYCKGLTGTTFTDSRNVSFPTPSVVLSDGMASFIQDYTNNEKNGVVESAINDFVVPTAIGVFSGGASLVYDVATVAYDIVKAFVDKEMTQEDVVKLLCEGEVAEQIKDIYKSSAREQLVNYIRKTNELLYKQIEKKL